MSYQGSEQIETDPISEKRKTFSLWHQKEATFRSFAALSSFVGASIASRVLAGILELQLYLPSNKYY